MTTFRRLLVLSLVVLIACVLMLLPGNTPYAFAEDSAHGGPTIAEANLTPTRNTGPAVKAPRKTENYTEKGMTPNPIAIDFDPQGNIYVVDAGRAGISVIDNRNSGLRKSQGVINDLQKQTVEDRLTQMNMLEDKGFYPKGIFNKADDKIHFIQDTDGDGVADKSTVFAENFNDKLDGIAAGVLWHEGKLYLTNIPHLWLLEDKDGDGDADKATEGERVSMSYGYGIRWAFYGHDMHGLIKGHDGRIYWSIGDRGFNVKTKEGNTLYGPDQGAVFRMWPDGSELEVYHWGLRNPQELAFDNYGNLFTGDNNSDSGDKARFIYLTEGGHSGWNQDVQSLRDRGPWNREKMWHPRENYTDPLQPQWQTPPLKNVGRGPSGLAHYPGVGDVFPNNGSFLMCDYPAGVRHVHVQPKGAGFSVVEDSVFPVVGKTITDVAWGYDGRLYLSDWGGGWKPNPNGYLKTMVNEAAHKAQAETIAEVKALFADGFYTLSNEKLIELIGHRDQRVRLNAQWELGLRQDAIDLLAKVLSSDSKPELSRLHAVWALGMQANRHHFVSDRTILRNLDDLKAIDDRLMKGLEDKSPNVRAQTISVLGDIGYAGPPDVIITMLNDKSAAVRYHAAIALGKSGREAFIEPLLDLLERNNNDDSYLRHAASYGLSLIGDAEAIHTAAQGKGPAARLGAVIALRHLKSPLLAAYLDDDDLLTAAEVARAIYDKRVTKAMPALAASADTLTKERMIEPIMRRVIEANVRLADVDSADRLAKLAANPELPEMWRLLALKELDNWDKERDREGVWGSWWPRPEQTMAYATPAMMAHLPGIATDKNNKIATLAREMMQRHVSKSTPQELAAIALNTDEPDSLRASVLNLLINADARLATGTAQQLVTSADASDTLRINARLVLIQLDPVAGQQSYVQAIESGTLLEQQDAIERLGSGAGVKGAVPGETFVKLTDALMRDELDPALRLEVIQAVQGNKAMPDPVRFAVKQYVDKNQLPGEAPYLRDTLLAGGSVKKGRELFLYHTDAQCMRCHGDPEKPDASTIGPWLGSSGAVHDLAYLYYAMVKPSNDIADGYASSVVNLKDGRIKTGRILKAKSDATKLVLVDSDGKEDPIDRAQIEGSIATSDQSQMPAMSGKLSPNELRDVLAYLATLKATPITSGGSKGLVVNSGPKMSKPAGKIEHVIWLPAILLGIAAGLGLILFGTMFGGETRA